MTWKGADSLIRSLESVGVDVIFGIPGGAILPAYDPLLDSPDPPHPHAARARCRPRSRGLRASDREGPGVCMATSGPGATNLVTPLADAFMDSVPIVAITGQVPRRGDRQRRVPGSGHHRHHDADHEAQLQGHGSRRDPRRRSPRRSTSRSTGRPGPVLVDIPKDVLQEETSFDWPTSVEAPRLPADEPAEPHADQGRRGADRASAERPVLYVGGGVLKARQRPRT